MYFRSVHYECVKLCVWVCVCVCVWPNQSLFYYYFLKCTLSKAKHIQHSTPTKDGEPVNEKQLLLPFPGTGKRSSPRALPFLVQVCVCVCNRFLFTARVGFEVCTVVRNIDIIHVYWGKKCPTFPSTPFHVLIFLSHAKCSIWDWNAYLSLLFSLFLPYLDVRFNVLPGAGLTLPRRSVCCCCVKSSSPETIKTIYVHQKRSTHTHTYTFVLDASLSQEASVTGKNPYLYLSGLQLRMRLGEILLTPENRSIFPPFPSAIWHQSNHSVRRWSRKEAKGI